MNHARSAINQFTTTHHHAIKPCILSSSETIFIHVYKQNVKDKKNKKKKKKTFEFQSRNCLPSRKDKPSAYIKSCKIFRRSNKIVKVIVLEPQLLQGSI